MASVKKFKVTYLYYGHVVEEEIFAPSEDDVIRIIKERGGVPIKIKREFFILLKPIDNEVILAFFENLKNLLDSGYNIIQALEILVKNEKGLLKSVLEDILKAMNEGKGVYESFLVKKEVFDTAILTMIKAGEVSGKLRDVISEIIKYLDTQIRLNKEIASKVRPNLVILGIAVIILYFMTLFVIPKITSSPFFKQNMEKYAGFALKLVNITTKLIPILTIVFVVASAIIYIIYMNYQDEVEKFLLKIPIIKTFFFTKEAFLAYYTISKLVEIGVRLEDAFKVVAETTKSMYFKKQFEEAAKRVEIGLDFSDILPMLDYTERMIVKGATNRERMQKAFKVISERKFKSYIEAMSKLPAFVQAFTMIIMAYFVLLIFFAVLYPYFKSIATMLKKL